MQNNPEIDAVVNNATTIAVGHKHGYVLTEHVLLAMVQYPSFRKILEKYGTPVEQLESELHNYLQSQTSLLTDRTDPPRKTNALERDTPRIFIISDKASDLSGLASTRRWAIESLVSLITVILVSLS